MYTIKDLADNVGLSPSQVRRRLKALDGLVENHRGSDNRILVDHNGLELLKRLENHRKSGMTTNQAVEEIKKELENNTEKPTEKAVKPRQSDEKPSSAKVENQQLKKRIEEKEELIDEYRQDKIFWKNKAEELEQKLLTGQTEEENHAQKLQSKLHEKEIEIEKMKMKLEEKKSPMERFWDWLGF